MKLIDNETINAALRHEDLIQQLNDVFQSEFVMPLRHHHFYKNAEKQENTLILMPVWNEQYLGVKQVIVAPNNHTKDLPAIHAVYTLYDAVTGEPLAQMDAAGLTARRTACTSALAASFLARKEARRLLVVGSGKVAQHLVQAHSAVRDYQTIQVWARTAEKGKALMDELNQQSYPVEQVFDLEEAVRQADVVSCATLSEQPIIKGEWLKAGTHLDLIGSHTPKTREADDEAIRRSHIYVDSREGALHETGELAIPIAQGILDPESVQGDIVELCKGERQGRKSETEITLFKSAGLAIEDLAAALLVYQTARS